MMTSIAYNIGWKNDNEFEFKQKHSLEKRKLIAQKYNVDSQCFVVCEAHRLYKKQIGIVDVPTLVVSKEDLVQNILNVLGKKLKLKIQEGKTIFLYCQSQILRNEEKIKDVYEKYNNKEDQILYIKFCTPEAFGCN